MNVTPRTMWNGSIAFGLVNIPVGLTKAQDRQDISFRRLHEECGAPIKLRKWCPHHEREVQEEELVHGYEYAPGEYVVVTDEDMAAIVPEGDKSLEVRCFVPAAALDPVMIDRTYYLVPAKETRQRAGYALLRGAMEQTKSVAIASFVAWNKQQLGMIRPLGKTLAFDMLYFAEDIRTHEAIDTLIGDVEVGAAEQKLALQITRSMMTSFNHDGYQNEHRDRVRAMLDGLSAGKHPKQDGKTDAQAPPDLMAALRASVAEKKEKPAKAKKTTATPRARTKKVA